MNFLAHHHLSGDDPQLQLGGWLGDFVKGHRAVTRWPQTVQSGIRLHRALDAWTDQHPAIMESKHTFPGEFRRFAGIILDLLGDHLLARDWDQYSGVELSQVEAAAYALLDQQRQQLPQGLQRFYCYASRRSLLSSYRDLAVIEAALAGIGRRLRRPNPLHRTHSVLLQILPEFERVFPDYYRSALAFAGSWPEAEKSKSTISGS